MATSRLPPITKQFIPNLFKVTLIKSCTKANPKVRSNLLALGISKINRHRYHKNSPEIRGMIFAVFSPPFLFYILYLFLNSITNCATQVREYVKIEELPLEDPATSAPTSQLSVASEQ